MSEQFSGTAFLNDPGPWTYAYVDGPGPEPQVVEESKRQSVRERLVGLGAPEADAAAVEKELSRATGVPSPSARYVLVRDGRVELDESFAEPRRGPEQFGYGAPPAMLPLLRHHAASARYLVVETGREGADVRLECATRRAPDRELEVEGRDDSLPKVQAGGWSHARYQRHSEEIWKHNQAEVAEAVDRLVLEERPAFVILAGDLRARQLLTERLAPASRELVLEVDAHTRAAGADETVLDEAIDEALLEHLRGRMSEALDRAAADNGSRGATGASAVLEALQQARVETLLLDARLVDSEETLEALDAAPWVAGDGSVDGDTSVAGDAKSLGRVPLAEGLARAALLTGATVHVLEEQYEADETPRTDRAPREPVAVLRWPESRPGSD